MWDLGCPSYLPRLDLCVHGNGRPALVPTARGASKYRLVNITTTKRFVLSVLGLAC